MAIGPLNKRVTFQQANKTPDEGGGFDIAWGGAKTVWAKFIPNRGTEVIANDRLENHVVGLLTIRSSSDVAVINSSWRVVMDGEPYSIMSINNPDQRSRWLEMIIERGGAQ